MNARKASRFLFLAIASLSGEACSSGSLTLGPDARANDDADTPDSATPEASTDASPSDAPIGDQHADQLTPDGGPSVWHADSTGFQLDETGGGLEYTPDVVLCTGQSRSWRYDATTHVVEQTGCVSGEPLSGYAVLSIPAAARLEALLGTVVPKGPSTSCGADAPDLTLRVFDPGPATRQYISDFYSGCSGFDAGSTAFVSFEALNQIISLLYDDLAACADGGSPAEAGVDCTPPVLWDAGGDVVIDAPTGG